MSMYSPSRWSVWSTSASERATWMAKPSPTWAAYTRTWALSSPIDAVPSVKNGFPPVAASCLAWSRPGRSSAAPWPVESITWRYAGGPPRLA